jgi:alkanesulfonate monooxygenase SsuD/methylene tetrahydromethanopterin reductase-like flavin-dependent oxidoreductase (luciferase family)
MQVWYMSECPYPDVAPEVIARYGSARASLPNAYCDPRIAARLYREAIDEYLLCDELGINIVLNEHHAGMNCLYAAHPMFLGILAHQTRRVRLLSLGTLITTRPDPVRVAEEYATADVLSGGRLEIGFVKSGGSEMASGNANPVGNTERFWEAIDLIGRALTSHDGPVSWEGRHFTHRHINIWPPVLQRPHPPFWAASGDAATARELGRRGFVNAVFPAGPARARATWDAYRALRPDAAADRFAYLAFTAVGQTDAEGERLGRELLWFLNVGDRSAPQYASLLPEAAALRPPAAELTVEQAIARGILFAGNPDTVHRQIGAFRRAAGPFGHLILMGRSGHMTHAQASFSIRAFAREVMPRLDG